MKDRGPPVRSDIQRALVAGFYMRVACRRPDGKYVRVKDNDVSLSSGVT